MKLQPKNDVTPFYSNILTKGFFERIKFGIGQPKKDCGDLLLHSVQGKDYLHHTLAGRSHIQ